MCYGDLDLSPLTLKINRVRLLVISSKCTKFEGPSLNGSVCIVSTSFVDRRTDRQTDRQTPAPYHNTSRQVGRIKTVTNFALGNENTHDADSSLLHVVRSVFLDRTDTWHYIRRWYAIFAGYFSRTTINENYVLSLVEARTSEKYDLPSLRGLPWI